ncbi:MAG: O-acetylhomoserine aminocarboxypropyltransferase/cysteine synthase [Prolixibacteraceae bacterium]|nr:O-acetylhomoserine aminocarboxypropyltransferase/cysteine synthase [Prolixibacteraceae bacterium]
MSEKNFTTRALNVPYPKKDPHNALQIPIYESVAFEFETAEDIAANFRGELPAHVYSRTGNPTVEYFEHKLKALTGGHTVLAVSSGMAAISNAILTLCDAGDNILSGKNLFGHTYALFQQTLPAFGIETRLADLNNIHELEKLIDDKTRILYFETVTNPQLEIPNIDALASIAKKHQLVLMADSTLTPPLVFKAKKFGIDLEVMSTTKFISGGATAVGGAIIDYGTFPWERIPKLQPFSGKLRKDVFYGRLKRNIFRNFGACMTAHSAYFQILGLDILELRLEKCVNNCFKLAEYLEQHPKVKEVNYPSLKSSMSYLHAMKYFSHKPGAIMTFDLESEEACFRFMNKLKIIRRATNLNDNKTLIIHPWSTIYVEFTPEQRAEMEIRPTMMRLSVGIEGVEDLMDDIAQALS